MVLDLVPLTKTGYDNLQEELERLKKVDRLEVIAAIAEAREHGDLKENAEYHAAREKQGFIEARIQDLEGKLSRAQVINPKQVGEGSEVRFGAMVTLSDEDTGEEKVYSVVGDLEADISQNKLSISSPMGKALLGKKTDELVTIKVPRGTKEYVIIKIMY